MLSEPQMLQCHNCYNAMLTRKLAAEIGQTNLVWQFQTELTDYGIVI